MTVTVLIVCVLGIVAALRIPVQMIPDLDVRVISVRTNWPGATPQDVDLCQDRGCPLQILLAHAAPWKRPAVHSWRNDRAGGFERNSI